MALSATLSELETWVRQDADMQAPDDRVTSSECRNRINRSLAHLYDRLVLVDQEYFLRSVSRTSNQSGKYDIQNDFKTGVVRSITSLVAGGMGYVNGATVTLSQGSNATATGTISASSGVLTGVTLTSGGAGYFDVTSTSPGWTSQSITPVAPVGFMTTPTIVGNDAFYVFISLGQSTIYKINLLTGAVSTSAPIAGISLRPCMAYEPGSARLYAVSPTGELYSINPVTLSYVFTLVVGAPAFVDNGVFYDPIGGGLYAADATTIYELDTAGTITNTNVPGYPPTRIVGLKNDGVSGKLLYQSTNQGILEIEVNPWVGPNFLAFLSVTESIASAVYASSPDKIYISGQLSTAWEYDYATATLTNITPILQSVSGYTYGPSFVWYDAPTDRVWFGAFAPSLTSNIVVSLDATTVTVADTIPLPSGVNLSVAILGSRAVIVGYPTFTVVTAPTFYIYNYTSGVITSPNYIILNVGGGTGGQVLAYIESDFYKCKGIWYSDAGGGTGPTATWFPLRRFQWEQQNALNQSANLGGSGALPLYRIMTEDGRDKALLSPDNAGGAFQLWYYPAPTRLLVDNDRFNGRAGWDDWIVKDVAIQLLMAEESIEQAAALKSIRDEIWERIQLHASDREASQPERIMDVTLLSRRYSRR